MYLVESELMTAEEKLLEGLDLHLTIHKLQVPEIQFYNDEYGNPSWIGIDMTVIIFVLLCSYFRKRCTSKNYCAAIETLSPYFVMILI